MKDSCVDQDAVTEKIIGCAFRVANVLGVGFLEKVYENALAHEIRKAGLDAAQQVPVKVLYDGTIVGDYRADILVEESVLVELKATANLSNVDVAQCLNYLKASKLNKCLLLNFGRTKIEVRRIVN